MNNPNINKLGYNTIPEQKLTYANQLTVREWNIIVNSLRAQTNGIVDFLKELYPWLIQDLNLIGSRITQINEQLPSGASKILTGNNPPTGGTEGVVGQLYVVTSNPPDVYQCYGFIDNQYVWEVSCDVEEALPYVGYNAPVNSRKKIWLDITEQEDTEDIEYGSMAPTQLRTSTNNQGVLDTTINENNEITLFNFEEDPDPSNEEITLFNFEE